MFTGLLIGLGIGMATAAALAWYFNMGSASLKPVEARPEPPKATPPARQAEAPRSEATQAAEVAEAPAPATQPPAPQARPKAAPPTQAAAAPKPRINYTFYGILPGDEPATPVEPAPSKETWWLQVAALSDRAKAEQIRAKLVMLNLRASTQKIDNKGQPLYRIRVGPYKREDDAFGDLDTLSENNFYARLLKDTGNSQ